MSVTDGDREQAAMVLWQGAVGGTEERVAIALAEEREKARAPFLALAERLRTQYKGEEWDAEGIADLIDEAAVDGQPVEFQRLNRPSTLRGRAVPRRAAEVAE